MVSWTKDFAQSQPWHIEHVLNGTTSYYNILPVGSQSQDGTGMVESMFLTIQLDSIRKRMPIRIGSSFPLT